MFGLDFTFHFDNFWQLCSFAAIVGLVAVYYVFVRGKLDDTAQAKPPQA